MQMEQIMTPFPSSSILADTSVFSTLSVDERATVERIKQVTIAHTHLRPSKGDVRLDISALVTQW